MKYILLLLISLPFQAISQGIEVLNSSTQSARAKINLATSEILDVTSDEGLILNLQN